MMNQSKREELWAQAAKAISFVIVATGLVDYVVPSTHYFWVDDEAMVYRKRKHVCDLKVGQTFLLRRMLKVRVVDKDEDRVLLERVR